MIKLSYNDPESSLGTSLCEQLSWVRKWPTDHSQTNGGSFLPWLSIYLLGLLERLVEFDFISLCFSSLSFSLPLFPLLGLLFSCVWLIIFNRSFWVFLKSPSVYALEKEKYLFFVKFQLFFSSSTLLLTFANFIKLVPFLASACIFVLNSDYSVIFFNDK